MSIFHLLTEFTKAVYDGFIMTNKKLNSGRKDGHFGRKCHCDFVIEEKNAKQYYFTLFHFINLFHNFLHYKKNLW